MRTTDKKGMRTLFAPQSARHRDRGDMTLSLVVVIIIVSATILALTSAITSFGRTTARASLETQAADAAQAVFEVANATPWQDLAMSTDDADLQDANVVALTEGRTLVALSPEKFEKFDPTPAKVEGGTENYGTINDNFTVFTAVTWERQPVLSSATNDFTATFGTKRVNVLVTWGENEDRQAQTFTMLRTPTVAEAVPTRMNVIAGGGLTVERDIDNPTLTGNSVTGALQAQIRKAHQWEIQASRYSDFRSGSVTVICRGEYPEVKSTTENCTYDWINSVGFTPSFRVKVWTLDTDSSNPAVNADGTKFSNTVTFTGPTIADLTGGKVTWNQDRIFWDATEGLMRAEYNPAATVETVITRRISGQPDTVTVLPYDIAGSSRIYTSSEGDNATYQVCTRVNGTSVACSDVFGPLYTIRTPDPVTLTGTRVTNGFTANYSWTSNAESYTQDGGIGRKFDVQQRNSSGEWVNVVLNTETTTRNGVAPYALSNGSGFLSTQVTLRVRVKNDAGFSPWTERTVTVGELPTAPSVSVSALTAHGTGGTQATFTWTAGSYATGGWDYRYSKNSGAWSEGTRAANGTRTQTYSGVAADSGRFEARGKNQFGVSAWAASTVSFQGAPTGVPTVTQTAQQGAFLVNWTAVASTTTWEIQYQVNGTTYDPSTCNSGISHCVASATRSATYDAQVNEGDQFRVRVRATNTWGNAAWSAWTTTGTALMRSVSAPTVTGNPHLSGGRYTWPALSCDTGNQAQYRVQDGGTWDAWSTSRAFTESFAYGLSGSVNVQQRCINSTTSTASSSSSRAATVGWRLLYETSAYGDYKVSDWTSNNWRRLQQILVARQDSGSCTSYATVKVDGSNFGRSPVNELRGDYNSYVHTLQCWLNGRDGSSNGNTTNDGYWGPDTTNKLRSMLAFRCNSITVSTSTSSSNAFDEYEMHRLTYCMNRGEY